MDACFSMCNCATLEKTFMNCIIVKDLRARLYAFCKYQKSLTLKYEDYLKFF